MNKKNDKYDIVDDGIFMVGENQNSSRNQTPWWHWSIMGVVVFVTIVLLIAYFMREPQEGEKEEVFPRKAVVEENATEEPASVEESASIEESFIDESYDVESYDEDIWYNNTDKNLTSCTISSDRIIDSVHLKILTPYNAVPELHVGKLNASDKDVVFATLAADVRSDNGKIVGAFVYAGEPLSWGGGRKLGYCAIIDGNITLGVAESSPLFEQATEQDGYFFRQYPAVNNGIAMKNNPKNASFRCALCMLNGEVCIVSTTDRVLMNKFSRVLVKLGVENAIFLVGGSADGWYRTKDGTLHRLGEKYIKGNNNINYIVFRAQ